MKIKIIISVVFLFICTAAYAQDKKVDVKSPVEPLKEIQLTELQSMRLELALQREWNMAKDLELLKRQFNDLQEKFPAIQRASQEAIDAACKESGVDPKTYGISNDFKKLIPRQR